MQQHREPSETVWNPFDVFRCPSYSKYAVIVLNRPIHWKQNTLLQVWKKAQFTVTVDGGTHRWLKYLEEQGIDVLREEHKQYIPDFITGDMDSCSAMVIEKLKALGSTIIETIDQAHTDYTKALQQVAQYVKTRNTKLDVIYVLVETSGRFDHTIGNIHSLYKSVKFMENIQVIHIASNALTWLLKPGWHTIKIPPILVQCQSYCGLLPIGHPVNCITTTGLKWNLNEATMEFGDLISTSNTYDNTKVTINTDTSIVWTMGIEPLREILNVHGAF